MKRKPLTEDQKIKAKERGRKWRDRNPEKYKQQSAEATKRYREKHPNKIKEASQKQKAQQIINQRLRRQNNREEFNAKAREYYLKNSEKLKARAKQYRLDHIDEVRESQAEYRKRNREHRNKVSRTYYHSHRNEIQKKRIANKILDREKHRSQNRSRAALKKAKKYGCKIGNIKQIKDFYNKTLSTALVNCYYCHSSCGTSTHMSVEIDHKTPLSKKGEHDFSNFAICCRSCNETKNNKTEAEFLKYLEIVDAVKKDLTVRAQKG